MLQKKKESGSWFNGNGKPNGSGGYAGHYEIVLRKKTRKKTKTILERLPRLGAFLYYNVYQMQNGRTVKDIVFPEVCELYGRFPVILRHYMDETGYNFESKSERSYAPKGSKNIEKQG